jgi:competence protein ComEA
MPPTNDVSPLAAITAFVLVVVAVIASGALLLVTRPEPVEITIMPPPPTATPSPTDTPAPYTVYVTGAVMQPQAMVSVPAGSRVQDAISAAGGVTGNADLERVNLADVLRDGVQVHVPAVGEVTGGVGAGVVENAGAQPGIATPISSALVNVNTATSEELQTLPRIGPAFAQRIIDYRQQNGPFTSLEDLDNVSGIGPVTLEQLAPLVTFDLP